MTTRTVEVERTVTDEEEVMICDDCGSETEDPLTFYPKSRKDELPDLHFHEDCFGNVTLEDYELEHVRGVDLRNEADYRVMLVMTAFEFTIATFGVIAVVASMFVFSVPIASIIAGCIGVLALLVAIGISRDQATDPADWFRE